VFLRCLILIYGVLLTGLGKITHGLEGEFARELAQFGAFADLVEAKVVCKGLSKNALKLLHLTLETKPGGRDGEPLIGGETASRQSWLTQ